MFLLAWDGTPHQKIKPGESWTASFQVDQHVSQTVVWDTFKRHHGLERSDSTGENLLALLAQLGGKFRPCHPSRTARGRKLGGCSGQVARRVES